MKTAKLILIFSLAAFFIACAASTTTTNQPVNTTANNPVNTAANNTVTAANNSADTVANTTTNSNTSNADPKLARVKSVYDLHCVKCHKESGEGGVVTIDEVDIDVPNLKDPQIAKEPDADYRKKIERGGDGMPSFKNNLSKEDINALISYIRTEFQGKK